MFGTFQEEEEEPVYGTVKPLASFNPLWANVEYYVEIARIVRGSTTLREKLYAVIAPPEWRPRAMGGEVAIPRRLARRSANTTLRRRVGSRHTSR